MARFEAFPWELVPYRLNEERRVFFKTASSYAASEGLRAGGASASWIDSFSSATFRVATVTFVPDAARLVVLCSGITALSFVVWASLQGLQAHPSFDGNMLRIDRD